MPVFQEPKTIQIYLYKGQDTEFLFSLKNGETPVSLSGKNFYIELTDGTVWSSDTGHWTEIDANTKKFRLPKTEIEQLSFAQIDGKMFYDATVSTKTLLYLLEIYLDKKC